MLKLDEKMNSMNKKSIKNSTLLFKSFFYGGNGYPILKWYRGEYCVAQP